jgi:6-phosphofructokinase 1
MAGKTDALICYKNGKFIHVPIPMAVGRSRTVDLDGDLWASVLACTGQPARFA